MNAWPSGLAVKSAGSDNGIGNVLLAVRQKSPGNLESLAASDAHARMKSGTDERDRVDELGFLSRGDHNQLSSPTDPSHRDW